MALRGQETQNTHNEEAMERERGNSWGTGRGRRSSLDREPSPVQPEHRVRKLGQGRKDAWQWDAHTWLPGGMGYIP